MPFVKGQSGNPGGNPGGKHGEKIFRNALLASLKKTDGDAEKIQRVTDKLVANAINGDTTAIREIADRLDGKPAQAIDVTGDDRCIIVEIRRFDRPDSLGGPIIDATATPVVEAAASTTAASAAVTATIEATPADVVGEVVELPNFLKIGHKQ
jgi:hypothetical protein